MKKLLLILSTLFVLMFSVNTLAGVTLGNMGDLGPGATTTNPNAVSPPNSKAFGRSLDAWVEVYLRNLFDGVPNSARNVVFLPIIGESPFDIEVAPGKSFVLPIALWLGFPGDPELGTGNFFGDVTLDGQPIGVPNEDYYIGPTYVDPLILDLVAFYEGLAMVIKPLTPGEHTIQLYSTINVPEIGLMEFNNAWNITVLPAGQN